jgi:DNA primase catalytic subunit
MQMVHNSGAPDFEEQLLHSKQQLFPAKEYILREDFGFSSFSSSCLHVLYSGNFSNNSITCEKSI